MVIRLLHPSLRLVKPGRLGKDNEGPLINETLSDEARLCWEICDESGTRITARNGRGGKNSHEEQWREYLQTALAPEYDVITYGHDGATVRFEAVKYFPVDIVIDVPEADEVAA